LLITLKLSDYKANTLMVRVLEKSSKPRGFGFMRIGDFMMTQIIEMGYLELRNQNERFFLKQN